MKIMIFSGGYLPAKKHGGPVASLVNFVEHLGDCYDIDIVCLNHDLNDPAPFPDIKSGFNPLGKANVLYISDEDRNTKKFKEIIDDRKPDCLYISSIFDFKMVFPILVLAKKYKLKVVYAPRGELSEGVLQFKALKKKIYLFVMRNSGIYKNIHFQATKEQEKKDTVLQLKVPENMVYTISNLSAYPICKTEFLKEKGSLRIVFIARIHKSKNLLYAIRQAKKIKGNVVFDIYGPLEHKDYWTECEEEIKTSPDNVKIKYCGGLKPGEATSIFAKYDCFLFPTLSENYSQAIAESVLAGTLPVISFGTTPWDDLNSNGGFALPLDKPEEFVSVLQSLCDMTKDEYLEHYNKLLEYRKWKINTDALCEKYKKMFSEVTGL